MAQVVEAFEVMGSAGSEPLLPSMERVREQLNRVVQSKTFQRARRLRSLLEYVVVGALRGDVGGQSRTARELFGKSNDFDPSLDPVIRVQFGRLRRALARYYSGEGKSDPIIIDIPNRRYSPLFQNAFPVLVMNGQPAKGNGAFAEISPARPVGGSRPLIAVLPFANLTRDPAQDSFCYGLTEEIANGLASVSGVDVVASSSTFQFKDEHVDVREVGRELGVSLVLEGSVRMEDGQTRVIAQLARSNDGVAVWSDSFDNKMNGSLNTQKSIAQKVMDTLPIASSEFLRRSETKSGLSANKVPC